MKYILPLMLFLYPCFSIGAPVSFEEAKLELRRFVFFDRNDNPEGTLYCGCKWKWVGASGGRIDMESCGYSVRAQPNRAERLEWEHIVPASNFGRARQCWQLGGRENCQNTDPLFNIIEADMHNLMPSVGEINADRSNFNYGVLSESGYKYGRCDFKVDSKLRIAEPRDSVKGHVARVYFYIYDRYGLRMSDKQQRLLMSWDQKYPPTPSELLLDARIAARMGHHNEFITGGKRWVIGRLNARFGIDEMVGNSNIDTKVNIPSLNGFPSISEVIKKNIQNRKH